MIPVTKPHLPEIGRYIRYIERCYQNNQLTNNGPLAQELKARLEEYLGVQNLLLVANGTLALQIAYKVLGVSKKAITTPFTFVATSSSLRWEGSSRSTRTSMRRASIYPRKKSWKPSIPRLRPWFRSMSTESL